KNKKPDTRSGSLFLAVREGLFGLRPHPFGAAAVNGDVLAPARQSNPRGFSPARSSKNKKPGTRPGSLFLAVREGLFGLRPHPFGVAAVNGDVLAPAHQSNPRGFSPARSSKNKKPDTWSGSLFLAVREGFEPSVRY